jgi:DNA-binding NtrC family response regulator
VARAIHRLSPRRNKPFIAVNIGALPETLVESELFGHEKGAFTGAAERRLGRFELANGGTLFLDEIGEAPLNTQVKLLRVLEQREVMRVGGHEPLRVDVRVVAATNRPLREHVEEGTFRPDLYYRLNVLTIYLPPLRERREDIPLLVRRFIQEFSERHDRPFHGISPEALQILIEYPWPGNVRELRNLVESMVVLSPGREITADDIPREIRDGGAARLLPVRVGPIVRGTEEGTGRELEFILRSLVELKLQVEELRRRMDEGRPPREWVGEVHAPIVVPGIAGGIEPRGPEPPANVVTIAPGTTMAEIERAAIEAALRETRGNRRKAAELLAIGERTLYRKLREYEIPEEAREE